MLTTVSRRVPAAAVGCALLITLLAACSSGGSGKPARPASPVSSSSGAAAPAAGPDTSRVPSASRPAGTGGTYAALGDSYTAAPLAHQQGGGPAAGCLRSQQDYPALVAAALHPASFVNVSCFGASTTDMSRAQRTATGEVPPQLNAVSAADTLITLQVG